MESLDKLIPAAAKGDMAAFNQLYEYSYATVERECLRILHNSIDAEDAIQESYLRIFRKLGTLKEPEKFLGWCRTIAHNESVSYIRNRKADKDDLKPPVSDEHYSGMDRVNDETKVVNPEEQAEQNMVQEFLQHVMDDIAPQRSLCLALHQQGYTYGQISDRLSIPVGTVKSNIFYAKQALREAVRELEKKENIQIFGFTLIPVAQGVEVHMQEPSESGFIQAETQESPMKQDVWDNISGKLTKSSASSVPLWQKATAVVIALALIVGGIVFAVNRAGRMNVQNRTKTVSVSQGEELAAGNNAGNRRLAPTARNNAAGENGAAEPGGPDITGTLTAARQTTTTPQTAGETTREVFTYEGRNVRNIE